MDAKILDGKKISQEILHELSKKTRIIKQKFKRFPKLVIILVGDDIASFTYVKNKIKACEKVNILYDLIKLNSSISEVELIKNIDKFNLDNNVDGIIVQLPLPKHINVENIIKSIDPSKDVDGFTPSNFGKMTLGIDCLMPATPSGIIELLKRYNIETKSKYCVIVGRSRIVGLPLSILLAQNRYPGNMTVTLCHSKTPNLKDFTSKADIMISAAGIPNLINSSMLKNDVIAIDVGINRVNDINSLKGYKIVGDICFDEVLKKASYITPVPGGIGPMTIAALLKNVVKSASFDRDIRH